MCDLIASQQAYELLWRCAGISGIVDDMSMCRELGLSERFVTFDLWALPAILPAVDVALIFSCLCHCSRRRC
jgi:hypothetical protein